MKKNRTMRVAVLMLALALVTCCFVGSTFAKYTSTASGEDKVTVADWEINVGPNSEVDITGADTITFDLFNTIKNTDGADEDAVTNGMIAPGTQGSFVLKITNNSDVAAEYSLTFTDTNAPKNLQFKVNGGAWGADIAAVAPTYIAIGATAEVTVEWQWLFGDANADDTADGIANKEVTVTATVLVEQIDKIPTP